GLGPGGCADVGRRMHGDRDPHSRRDRTAVPARACPDGRRGGHYAAPQDRTARPAAGRAGRTRRCGSPPAGSPRRRRRPCARHAEGAGDAQAVLRHAPDAAKRSAALGAHREAAAQYERALRCAENLDKSALAALYEGLASEYSLLDRWEQAEGARRAALALRRELGDEENVGANLRLLSITLWRLCRGKESNRTAEEAVAVLEALPPGKELGWAYTNLANSGMALGTSHEDMQRLLGKARDIGEQFGYPDVVCYALNGAGLCLVDADQDGMPEIEESLRLALATDLPESAGRAYSSLVEAATRLHRFPEADRY